MNLYNFLNICLKSKNLKKFLSLLIKNYKIFDFFKKLENKFDLKLFNLKL
jgi:hypothetical protein